MKIEVTIPDGRSGQWEISTFQISEDQAYFHNLRAIERNVRSVSPGEYKKLTYRNQVVMSNTPAEIDDHLLFIREARNGSNILINGLGLGVALIAVLESPKVQSVTVIEKSTDVINLVSPYINDDRVKIINADAFEWTPPKGMRYDAVWHDIWNSICGDNLLEMTRLHRKYGKRCNWQGSWCKSECRAQKKRGC